MLFVANGFSSVLTTEDIAPTMVSTTPGSLASEVFASFTGASRTAAGVTAMVSSSGVESC